MTVRGFTRCDECENGIVGHCSAGLLDCDLHRSTCPSCSGSGLVPTEELRKMAAHALLTPLIRWGEFGEDSKWETLWPEDREILLSYADAVLRKVAEHLGGRE